MKTISIVLLAATLMSIVAQAQNSGTTAMQFKNLTCAPVSQNKEFVLYKGAVTRINFNFVSASRRTGLIWALDYTYRTNKGDAFVHTQVGRGKMTEVGRTFVGSWEEGDTLLNVGWTGKGKEFKGELTLEQDFKFLVTCIASEI